jgi:anti-sigma-K factor RskA
MSDCPTHGHLVGGYALGALDPDEMEDMRRHVAECPRCGPEAARLGALPTLLDRIEPADVPPPSLSPQVEEAVLDQFARERGKAQRRARRLPRPRRLVAVAVAGLAAVAAALALLVPLGGDDDESAYASVSLGGLAAAREADGMAELQAVEAGTRISLEASGLPAESDYEVWCIREDGKWISGGTFHANRNGWAEADLTAAVQAGDYHRMVVTGQPPEGEPRGATVMSGKLRY